MPNRNSHSGHIAERSCVVCKKKIDRNLLLQFFTVKNKIVYDIKAGVSRSKRHVCHEQPCLDGLIKWLKERKTKR